MGYLERENKFITEFPVSSSHFRMLLLNYLGKIGPKTPLKAAATFSVGWNTFACSESLEKPLNWLLFNYYLTTCLQSSVNKWVISETRCCQSFWITCPNSKKCESITLLVCVYLCLHYMHLLLHQNILSIVNIYKNKKILSIS